MSLRPWREWTLRTRMVVSIAALAAVALVVANVAGALLLHSYLVARIDTQLRGGTRLSGRSGLIRDLPSGPRVRIGPDVRVILYDGAGQQIPEAQIGGDPSDFASSMPDLGSWSALRAHRLGHPYTVGASDGSAWRVVMNQVPDTTYTVVTAVSLREVQQTTRSLITTDLIVTSLILLLIAVAAAKVVRLGLKPLTRMERFAAEVSGSNDLSRRVDADPHTESGRLGTALNAMLVRIESALEARTASEQRLRQFLADASHELRTPLTSIQGFAELYRRGGTPPGPQLDEAMQRVESEVVRMRVLVNDLLLLARLDEERPLARMPVDLLAVAAETVRDAHVRVPTRFVQLAAVQDAFDTFEPVTVIGDLDRLQQVATNLIANALQHTPEDTRVVVRVGRFTVSESDSQPTAAIGHDLATGQLVGLLEVADTGPGIEPDDAERVFERLYRAERSRDRRHGGAGLGLAIVAAIVQAHSGRVELFTAPGQGCRFRILLPAVAESDDDSDDSELASSFPEAPVEPVG